MIQPARAPVRPRFIAPETGETLLLEDELAALLAAGKRGVICIVGAAGSGKTTALEHLAALFGDRHDLALLDVPHVADALRLAVERLVICTSESPASNTAAINLQIARWGTDDLVEYLLAVHKEQCASVMARLRPDGRLWLAGIPELWRVVLDRMAADPAIPDAETAIAAFLDAQLQQAGRGPLNRSIEFCLQTVCRQRDLTIRDLANAGVPREVVRLLSQPPAQFLLVARQLAEDLRRMEPCDYLKARLPREVIQRAAPLVAAGPEAISYLDQKLVRTRGKQAMAASLLYAAVPGWQPRRRWRNAFDGAHFAGAVWPGINLTRARLRHVDFSGANLRKAALDGCIADSACFSSAVLAGASLRKAQGRRATFTNADLTSVRADQADFDGADFSGAKLDGAQLQHVSICGADLTGATLRGANLSGATLGGALLAGADFSDADLSEAWLANLSLSRANFLGACFRVAWMEGCNLEEMRLDGALMEGAHLLGAYLTGAMLRGSILKGACLRETGLAEIDLEGADLRDADLRGATFHMGSSRSGLVFSPYASEGSRTGFYTDDFSDQDFKSPEEIRKANLCGADLRGARIDDVDFYLVDLRGARYDRAQEQHLRRCGAILTSRCGH